MDLKNDKEISGKITSETGTSRASYRKLKDIKNIKDEELRKSKKEEWLRESKIKRETRQSVRLEHKRYDYTMSKTP